MPTQLVGMMVSGSTGGLTHTRVLLFWWCHRKEIEMDLVVWYGIYLLLMVLMLGQWRG